MSPAPPGRVFRRTTGARAVATSSFVVFLAAAVALFASSGPTPGLFVLAGLALLSLAGLLGAWADRYTLGDRGVEYRNGLLACLGARPRLVPWEEIAQVREHRVPRFGRPEARASALFLVLRSGRRVVLDSLQDFDELRALIGRHCDALRDDPQ